MHEIKGTTIRLTRGDSFYVRVGMKHKDGTVYTPHEGDVVRFALSTDFTKRLPPLVLKDIPIDTQLLHLVPEDTTNLDYGVYRYDIELTTADGDVDTFIEKAKFKISEEVW